jgi:hypothetical protein
MATASRKRRVPQVWRRWGRNDSNMQRDGQPVTEPVSRWRIAVEKFVELLEKRRRGVLGA